jgi:molybdopterin adenylyltransferase
MKFARVTLSDRAHAGIYDDRSGRRSEHFFTDRLALDVEWTRVLIPDDLETIEQKPADAVR